VHAMEHQNDWRLVLRHRNDEFSPFLLTLCNIGSSLLLRLGSMTSPYGAAPAPFSPFSAVDKAKVACPDLSWVWNVVKWHGDGEFRALGFQQQGLKMGSHGSYF
jgi:hypothetical protein